MHLLSWVCEFESARPPQATEDMLVTRFKQQTLCVHLEKPTLPPPASALPQQNYEVFQPDSLIDAGRLKFTGTETLQSADGFKKNGTVVVSYITAWYVCLSLSPFI